MSVAFISGFETRDFKEWSSTQGTPAINTSIQPSGDACAEFDAAAEGCNYTHGSTLPDWACSFRFRFSATPSSSAWFLRSFNAGINFQLELNTSRELYLQTPSSATGSAVLSTGTWYMIHITYNYVDGSNDEIKIYIDDAASPDIDWTGVINNDSITWRLDGYADGTFYFDDFRLDDVATQIGDHKIVRADVIDMDITWNYDTGDETDLDDWVTGVDDGATTEAELTSSVRGMCGVDDYSTLGLASDDDINAIKISGIIMRSGGQGREQYLEIQDHGDVEDTSPDLNVTAAYLYYEYYTTFSMPTPTQFNDWNAIGKKSGGGGQDFIITAKALMIDYSPGGVTDFPLDVTPGSYALTGDVDTAGFLGAMLNAGPSSYALTGDPDTAPLLGAMINAVPDSYAVSGVVATLLRDAMINAAPDSYAITGIDASLLRGLFLDMSPGAYAITGVDAELLVARGMNASPATYAITGVNGSLLVGRVLSGDPGVYAISGVDAILAKGFAFIVDPATYAITGVDTNQLLGRVLNAEPGGYTASGVSAELLYGAILSVDPGGYSISGQSATLNFGFVLVTDVGAYVISGINASLLIGRALNAETTTYSVTGVDGSLISGRVIQLDVGSYILTGIDANLLGPSLFIDAGPGVYSLSGIAATVLADQLLSANPGNYLITGVATTLLKGFELSIDSGSYSLVGLSASLIKDSLLATNAGRYSIARELITGGQDMDDGNWVGIGFLTTNEQTDHDEQTDCRHIISPVQYRGVRNDPKFTTVTGTKYQVNFRLKVINGTVQPIRMKGDNSGQVAIGGNRTESTWTNFSYEFTETAGGPNAYIFFRHNDAGSPTEWYVDEVSVRTGTEASLVSDRVLNAAPTTYSITGVSGSLVVGRVLSADPDSYLLTGQVASLLTGRALSADNGSYALAGQNASILIGRALSADPSSYSVVGQPASLAVGYLLVTDVGSYLLTGPNATLVADRMINGGPGVYSVTGVNATLVGPIALDYPLNLEPGIYALTGEAGAILADRLLSAVPGTYVVAGELAVLERVYIGALVVYYRNSPLTTIMSGNAPFDLVHRDKPKKVPA